MPKKAASAAQYRCSSIKLWSNVLNVCQFIYQVLVKENHASGWAWCRKNESVHGPVYWKMAGNAAKNAPNPGGGVFLD
jgi:hypothetical protein